MKTCLLNIPCQRASSTATSRNEKNGFGSMKAYGILCLIIISLITGCQTSQPDVATNFDPVTGARTDLMSENILETPESPPREVVWLNASRLDNSYFRRKGAFYLEVNYMARTETGYLEIPVGTTL